jgi:hypothetical protein
MNVSHTAAVFVGVDDGDGDEDEDLGEDGTDDPLRKGAL